MDSFKLAIYLYMQSEILRRSRKKKHGEPKIYLCSLFRKALSEVYGMEVDVSDIHFSNDDYDFIKELFPEFLSMFDGYHWCRSIPEPGMCPNHYRTYPGDSWWEPRWMAPRLRMLNFIITHRL